MKKAVAAALNAELKEVGSTNPKKIYAYAKRHKNSVWHKWLGSRGGWNTSLAAEKWCIHEIGGALRKIKVVVKHSTVTGKKIVIPVYKSLPDRRGNGYEEIQDVMSDDDRRTVLLKETIRRLQQIKEVSLFEELADVFNEIERAASLYLNGSGGGKGKGKRKGKGGRKPKDFPPDEMRV